MTSLAVAGAGAVGRLSSLGRVGCLFLSMAMVMGAQGPHLAVACVAVAALAVAFHPAGLRSLASRRAWLFVALLLIPAALFLGPGEEAAGSVLWWLPGLLVGAQMAVRALAILVAVGGFAASVSVSELAGLMERAGLKGLGFAIGVAVNILPTIQETFTNAYHALRLRGGFRRRRLRALRCLLVTVIANSLRHAEDIVSAAEARAFSAERSYVRAVEVTRTDVVVCAGLAVLTLALLLL